ncbi:hypothetical protein IWW38_003199 [Coemansia aciculifera]|uniref:Uncharacterized protein n=1 Tax=Coemansia aciculifera TaxID=417176 RepID=A0ACC1M1B0_9FUNG|nr:hypothetical protein IWW38_003199 [Coemansia aciculifera]
MLCEAGANGVREFIQTHLSRDCKAVCKLAAPDTTALCTKAAKLAEAISADLEACLSQVIRGKGDHDDLLDMWAGCILKWTGFPEPTSARNKVNVEPEDFLGTVSVATSYESLLLFVAHHVHMLVNQQSTASHLELANCQLVLPVANESIESIETEDSGASLTGFTEFSPNSDIAKSPAVFHLVVANTEIVTDLGDYDEAVLRLAMRTKVLYSTQHNRRFAWGLTVCCRNIRAYDFGGNGAWSSSDMDIASASGRQTFISLLVNWSLCSVDRLGFDLSIRYAFDNDSSRPYFEIDVHEKNASTGEVASRTYFSNRCVGVAAASLTGRHARYFAASDSFETMRNPTVMIKDVWMPMTSEDCSDEALDGRSILDALHTAFGSNSEFGSKFPQLVSTGPVYLCRGDEFVEDTTATVLAGLPIDANRATTAAASSSNSHGIAGRQHTRTVMKWAGDTISAADNPSQVVIAIADAMTALSAVHKKCNIVHGNISDRAILFQMTADRVKGALAGFDYATYANGSARAADRDLPELTMFQSIRSLENAAAPCSPLEDWESLLYLVIFLGTHGINDEQRREFFRQLPRDLPIMEWISDNEHRVARHKRDCMDSVGSFDSYIRALMSDGPLCNLA